VTWQIMGTGHLTNHQPPKEAPVASPTEKLAERIDAIITDYEDNVDMAKGRTPYRSVGDVIVESLGLKREVETYAMPDSARHRWTTSWEEGER
jgi:hypothetical protein